MTENAMCHIDGCDQAYFCGVGMPPLDVCYQHFVEYLMGARSVIDQVRRFTEANTT